MVCCVRTYGTRCLVFGDTLFQTMDLQVCVCVCVCKRAATDGAAADDMVRTKRSRYPPHKNPGCSMVSFVVEALGRLSPDAEDLLRALAPVDKQTRSVVLRRAKQSLSVVIQTRLADLLLGAERSRGAAAPGAA